jgi:Right handed beta helix region
MRLAIALLVALALPVSTAQARTLAVGPGKTYNKPCAAIAAAHPGDTVRIDARGNGRYDGDVCASSTARLTIEGVHGRARIAAAGASSQGKAIWVLSGAHVVVRNVELSGARVPDRNGAAIHLEGGSLTLDRVSFHDDEDGILVANDPRIDLTITRSQFARNGAGDGYSHNIYVGAIHRFTLRGSWSHDARVGHLVKSRAAINDIVGNRLTGAGGTGSYELDLPNGGRARVTGNVIEQGPRTENPNMLAFGEEGAVAGSQLTLSHNTFVNDRPAGGTAVLIAPSVSRPATITDNIATGATTFVAQSTPRPRLRRNCLAHDPRFRNRKAYDYRLRAGSPCRGRGAPAAVAGP